MRLEVASRLVGLLVAAIVLVGLAGAASAANTQDRVDLTVWIDGSGTVWLEGHHAFTCHYAGENCERSFSVVRGRRIVARARARNGWKLIKWGGACKGRSKTCALRPKAQSTVAKLTLAPPGDWLNPYPLGATVTSANWEIRVLGATLNADPVMKSAGNPQPPTGTQYALVHLTLTNVASVQEYLDLYTQELITKGVHKPHNPNGYFPGVGPMPASYLDLTRVGLTDPAETVTGYLAYRIASDDASTLELNIPGHYPIWLALH